MSNFLLHIARSVYRKHKDELGDICMVFPGRRAGLYFSKYLTEITEKPIWSPGFLTINDLMQNLSDITVTGNLELVFELFKVYRKEIEAAESFDDFYYWGEMLLNDFDDVDKYLAEPQDLFRNLQELKQLEDHLGYLSPEQIETIRRFWKNLDPGNLTPQKADFLSIWSALGKIYTLFRHNLKEKGTGYEGMVYREVAERIRRNGELDLKFKKYILVGFNALNPCETLLFSWLQQNNLAEFYWDYDEAYLDDPYHEAGYFIRKNLKLFPPPSDGFAFDSLRKQEKKIEIISVPSEVSQARIIQQVIRELPANERNEHHHTAVVLADEQLLVPVLHAIPEEIRDINVTMGYPLRFTPLYSLVRNLIDLQRRTTSGAGGECLFYHKPVLAILNHPYFIAQDFPEAKTLAGSIISGNRIFIPGGDLAVNELFGKIFRKVPSTADMSGYLLEILLTIYDLLRSEAEEARAELNQEYVYHLYLTISCLEGILEDREVAVSLATYLKIIDKLVKSITIPFTGEPLAGLQVMGILETRALDFEHLIMLSMNEGILPKSQSSPSFIPYNLRRGFGLPTLEHQDSIFAYYFYRLIQRAGNITLIYNSSPDGMKTGEMSRFLTQLRLDPDLDIREKELGFDIHIMPFREIRIRKDTGIMQHLAEYAGNGNGQKYLSPSGINTYLDCSLKFYLRHVAGLKEPEQITEEIDPLLFGNILHRTINILYSGFTGKSLDRSDLEKILHDPERISKSLVIALGQETGSYTGKTTGSSDLGARNLVILEVLKKYIRQIISVDMNYLPMIILSLEKKFKTLLAADLTLHGKPVRLGGTIDRIDRYHDTLRVIDYKTGSGTNSFKQMEDLFTKGDYRRNRSVLQTFLYCYLVSEEMQGQPVTPGLYFMRDLFQDTFDYRVTREPGRGEKHVVADFNRIKDEFSEYLKPVLAGIFDRTQDFTQTEDETFCRYCEYRRICHRE